jgi:hypothetical protein
MTSRVLSIQDKETNINFSQVWLWFFTAVIPALGTNPSLDILIWKGM